MAHTLGHLELTGVTAFKDEKLSFSSGLNVVIGDNGTGKTHTLNAAYSMLAVLSGENGPAHKPEEPTESHLQARIAEKRPGVPRPEQLGRLVARRRGRSRSAVFVIKVTPVLNWG